MAKKDTFNLNSLPTIEQLTDKSLRRGQKLIEAGNSPLEVSKYLEYRNMEVRNFVMQNFDLLESRDKDLLERSLKYCFKINLGAFIPAIGLNIALRSFTRGRIFDLPFAMRFLIRTSIFVTPIAYSANYSFKAFTRLSLYLEDKYGDRIQRFSKTGNPAMINPYYDQEMG